MTLGRHSKKQSDVGYYLETLFLESNKNFNFTSCFSKITGFIMLKANLQEFNCTFNIQSFVKKIYTTSCLFF
jgi:hypothetical protein